MPLPSSSTSTSISSSYSHMRPSDWSRQNLNRIEQFCIQCRESVPVRPNAFHIATIDSPDDEQQQPNQKQKQTDGYTHFFRSMFMKYAGRSERKYTRLHKGSLIEINADLRSNYGIFADSDVPLTASGYFQTKAVSRFVKVRLAIEKFSETTGRRDKWNKPSSTNGDNRYNNEAKTNSSVSTYRMCRFELCHIRTKW